MYHSYVRISKDPDNTSEAIERQIADNKKKARELGWDPLELVPDRNKSAWRKRGSRPGFNRILELIRTGQTEGIIVWNIDRLLRRNDELEQLIEALDANPVPIQTSGGVLNLSDPGNKAVARILVTIAAMESDIKQMRVKRALEGKVQERAYGDDPSNHLIVKWIASQLIAGSSYAEIAQQLNEDGHLTSRGKAWKYSTVRQVILNPRIVPTIIGDRRWIEVQKAAERRAKSHTSTATPRYDYILGGVLQCATCNLPMVGRGEVYGGKFHPRYGCNPNRVAGGCDQGIQAPALEDQVLGWIRSELAQGELQEIRVAGMDPIIAERIDRLEHAYYVKDKMDEATFERRMAELQAEAQAQPITVGTRLTLKEFDSMSRQDLRMRLPYLLQWVRIQPWNPHGPRRYDPSRVTIRGSSPQATSTGPGPKSRR